jgi:hypothetical protein
VPVVKLTIAAVLAVLAEAAFVRGVELHAPWSGLVIALSGGMLMAVGFAAGPWGIIVAAAVVAASLVGADLKDDAEIEVTAPQRARRLRSQLRLWLGDALVLVLPMVAAVTGLGAAFRPLAGAVRRLRH